jgi:hypothetical protein
VRLAAPQRRPELARWPAALRTGDKKIESGTDVNPRNPQNPCDKGFEGSPGPAPANFLSHWDAEDWQAPTMRRSERAPVTTIGLAQNAGFLPSKPNDKT